MSHALVIGGTGMLRGVSEHLARQVDTLTVVARRSSRLDALASGLEPACTFVPLALDYRDTDALSAALRDVQSIHGPIETAVCWIHSVAPDAPRAVAEAVGSERHAPVRYVHVVGSAAADPHAASDAPRAELGAMQGVVYQQVILGFVLASGGARWLTNEEISAGVIAALGGDQDPFIVGTVRPWSSRP